MNSECCICLSSEFGLSHDDPLPAEMKGHFYPEMCPLHKMHMSCARNNAKAERLRHQQYLRCPACRTQYTTRDLEILLPLRRDLGFQTTLEPLDDHSNFYILLLEEYNASLHQGPLKKTKGLLRFRFDGSTLPTTRVSQPSTCAQRVNTSPLSQHPSMPQTPNTLNFWVDRFNGSLLRLHQQQQQQQQQEPQNVSELRRVLRASMKAKEAIGELGNAVNALEQRRTIERRMTRSQTSNSRNLLNRMKARVSGAKGCLSNGFNMDLTDYMLENNIISQ